MYIAYDNDPHLSGYMLHYRIDGRYRPFRWVKQRTGLFRRAQWGFAVGTPFEMWTERNSARRIIRQMRSLVASLGTHGWEAVGFVSEVSYEQRGIRYLFKRPAISNSERSETSLNQDQHAGSLELDAAGRDDKGVVGDDKAH